MARPDKTKNSHVAPPMDAICPPEPTKKTISQEKARTTRVRTAVATVESVCRIPHFANMAVTPAKKAEPNANKTHMYLYPLKR